MFPVQLYGAPGQSWLHNPGEALKNISQRLKPAIFLGFFGTAKARALSNHHLCNQF